MKTPSLRLLLTSLVLAPALIAQTWTGATSLDWDVPSNWDPATVPADPGAVATFTAAGLDPEFPNSITMTTGRTLGRIVFAADAGPITLYAGHVTDPTTLVLDGAGLTNLSAFQQRVWLSPAVFTYPGAPSTLEFRNQATVAGDVRLIAIGENRHIDFHDQTSAGTATIASYNTDFHDQSTAGSATFDQTMAATVSFHDQSTAGTASLPGLYGSVTFADFSSAANATLQRPQAHGSSSTAYFRDHSTAANSALYFYDVEFSGESTAAAARINTSGTQVYSSHGAYSTHFSATTFRDASRAGDAMISVNSLATLSFLDSSSAERASIINTGRVTFENRATFADTRLQAGSGTYYGYGGYNEPAPTITVGDVILKDQATGGNGRIEITSAATKLDFSGLYDVGGTTGRALLPAGTPPAAVAPDDARAISLGAITNTSPGGTLFLGATILSIGTANQDMILSALVRDTGGAYGSAAGAPLRGGSLVKVGDGTLTISNPDNDYTGVTTIVRGTVNLAGGRIQGGNIFANTSLTGTGVVRGQVVNSGLVSPGNSAGSINVAGDYTQNSSGTLRIELISPEAYDRLAVTGTATLGGTLELVTPGDFVPVGSVSFPFLSAGAINGTFATVTPAAGLGAALSSQLVYGATTVSVQLTQHPFASFGSDLPAATALGAHLDATLAGATGEYRTLIAGLNTLATAAEINIALTALAPDRYSTLASNGFLSAAVHQSAQDRRFAAARAEADAHGFGVFFEGSQHRSEFDAAPGLAAAESTLAGATGGVAWNGNGFTAGVAVTQEQGDVELDETGSRTDLESTAPAVFFQYSSPAFFVTASAAFSNDDYDLRRRIVYPGVDLTATGQTSGQRQDFAVTIGRDFRSGAWAFTPQAGLLASRWELDGFTEGGAAGANLTLPHQSLRSLRTRLALDVAARNPTFVPRLSVAWLHETETDRSIRAAFASGPAYVAPGRPAARDLLQASAGFDWKLGRRAAFYATAAGAWGDAESIALDLSAGFRWQF